jgi:asparagine synthase (glutamine-hydrolysing)
MCGIAGILHFNNQPVSVTDIKKMTDTLIHRGPDGEGQWINAKGNIGLGHRRLSIIDLSTAGHQPMHYANNRYTITFNGEIYNYIELKDILIQKGYQFKSNTDTEVILAAYHLWGKNCLHQFDGMFAFAIWDEELQELFCARDRFGEKPFYYYKDSEKFIFTSEIKAFWQVNINKQVETKFIYDYLLFGTIQNANDLKPTFYKTINNLEPSCFIKINSTGDIFYEKYWSIDYKDINTTINLNNAKEQFLDLFTNSITKRLRSDVAVGSSLSGGIDSSSIVTIIDQIKNDNQPQKTFSARFKNFSKDEGYFINTVLNNTKNVDAYDVYPDEHSVLNNLGKIIYHQDEPFGSFSIAAQYEVMQLAKKNNTTVLLDGQGADEYLAGYSMYYNSYYNQLYKKNKSLYKTETLAYQKLFDKPFNPPNFSTKIKTQSESTYQKIAHLRRKKIASTNSYFLGIHPDIVSQYKTDKNPIYKPANLKEHLYSSITQKGLGELLRYADRNSMAHSVEVRLPFLNHQLVEFVFSLPEKYLINNAWTKYILRASMENSLPQEIAWRKDKIGYEPPQEKWLKNKFFTEMVEDAKSKLITEKVISNSYDSLNWQYLMLANYID